MWHPFETNELYVTALAARIADILHNAVQRDGAACMAVSGGHPPIALFKALNRADIALAHVRIRCLAARFAAPADTDRQVHIDRHKPPQNQARRTPSTELYCETPTHNIPPD